MSMDVHIDRQVTAGHDAVAAMYLFGSFRASERKKLLALSQKNKKVFLDALEDFLERWATANWLEEYNVERVGAWIGKHCTADIQSEVLRYLHRTAPANSDNKAVSVRASTYQAFQRGLGQLH